MWRYALWLLLVGALLASPGCSGSRVSTPAPGAAPPPAPRALPSGPANAGGAEKSSLVEKAISPDSSPQRDGSHESSYIYVPAGGER
jgi:hypothetical protein